MAPAYATLRGVIVAVLAFLEETDGDLDVDSYEKVNIYIPKSYKMYSLMHHTSLLFG